MIQIKAAERRARHRGWMTHENRRGTVTKKEEAARMLQDALRADGRALAGYRLLVVQPAFVAGAPICAALEAQGAEIVGPAASLPLALRLAGSEPIDATVLDASPADAAALVALLAAEFVPLVALRGGAGALLPGAGMHDLVARVVAALEG